MKRRLMHVVIWLAIASLLLPACQGGDVSSSEQVCQEGICVTAQLVGPILFDQPVDMIITVETDEDIPKLQVIAGETAATGYHEPSVIVEGEYEWTLENVAAHTPVQRKTTVRFTAEGLRSVLYRVYDPQLGRGVFGEINVQVTSLGGTANPTIEVSPIGTTEGYTIGSTPPPGPPDNWERWIPYLKPEEVLKACGWEPGEVPLASWGAEEAHIWVEVPRTVPLDTPVPVQIGVEFPEEQAQVQVNLALCLPGPDLEPGEQTGVVMEGERAWQIEAAPGEIVTFTTTLRFTQEGEIPLRAGAYAPDTGQAMSDGERTWIIKQETRQNNNTGWVWINSEDFESGFPSDKWAVVHLDESVDAVWDDDNYRPNPHPWDPEGYAIWPARGGSDGINPVAGRDHYLDNMDTRMVYGPFDLGDAVAVEMWFSLWYDIETGYDFLKLEASNDGIAFDTLETWSNSDIGKNWQQIDVDLSNYIGDDDVWVAWHFTSDGSVTKGGPWIDDLGIQKYVPGWVTTQGTFFYYDRHDQWIPAHYTNVYLYDDDGAPGPDSSDDQLARTSVDDNGYFSFAPRRNWDTDGLESDVSERLLDLYVVAETDFDDNGDSRQWVANYDSDVYMWPTDIVTNVSDGVRDFIFWIPNDEANEGAMWIFQDMRRAWEYIYQETGDDPGPSKAIWQRSGRPPLPPAPLAPSSLFWPYEPVEGIQLMPDTRHQPDNVIHELAHQYMYNANGFWFWDDLYSSLLCLNHDVWTVEEPLCAWTEGWADYFPMAVSGLSSYDWKDLETPTWGDGHPLGDTVEGRVAGALYDLFDDNVGEVHDSAAFGFAPIWDIVGDNSVEWSFYDFWQHFGNNNDKHTAVQSIYQNTIVYNTAPVMSLPNVTARAGSQPLIHAVDLWAKTTDNESDDSQLIWTITDVNNWQCSVTLDGQYANIQFNGPPSFGSCIVTIQVSDGIVTVSDTFNIIEVSPQAYLPMSLTDDSGAAGMNGGESSGPYPPPESIPVITSSTPYP